MQDIQCPRTPPCWTYGPATGTRINPCVTVLPLASTSGTRKHAATLLVGSGPPGQDTDKFLHQLFIFLLLFFFELIFRNRNLVLFTDCRFISNVHDIEALCPTRRAKRCVDAKINTLESEGKCSPSSGKSIKRASQFDL